MQNRRSAIISADSREDPRGGSARSVTHPWEGAGVTEGDQRRKGGEGGISEITFTSPIWGLTCGYFR